MINEIKNLRNFNETTNAKQTTTTTKSNDGIDKVGNIILNVRFQWTTNLINENSNKELAKKWNHLIEGGTMFGNIFWNFKFKKEKRKF